MHELSIAYNLVEVATEALQKHDIQRSPVAIHLRLGRLSGVDESALLFGYDIAIQDTLLANSKLVIETVPAVIHCMTCGDVELPSIQSFFCPNCDSPAERLISGRELEIASIEVADMADMADMMEVFDEHRTG